MVKSASIPARVISGQSRVSVFIVIRQPPSTGSMVRPVADQGGHDLGRYGEPHPHGVPHRHGGDPGPHELQRVLGGQLARPVAPAGEPGLADPVDAEAAPVLAVAVVADEVPPATERDQPVRLDVPLGLAPPRARCRRSARGSSSRQPCASVVSVAASTVGPRIGAGIGLRLQRVHPAAQPRRHQRQHLGERLDRGLLHALHRAGRRRTQADRDRDRLLVLEQQRRQRPARAQLVAAGDPADGVDLVAELAQPVDVAAQGAGADLEPVGQLAAGPVAMGLEQGQQPQHPSTRVRHGVQTKSH